MYTIQFLYREILDREIDVEKVDAIRSEKPERLPVVLSRSETKRIISLLQGKYQLVIKLLYGSGWRVPEGIRLCVHDPDCDCREILVCDGKGFQDHRTILPECLVQPLQDHLVCVKRLH